MDYSKYLSVSLSGGRSSAYSAWLIINNPNVYQYEKIIFTFANTGQERPETIEFLQDIEKYWNIQINVIEGDYSNPNKVGFKDVNWSTLSMDSKPFEDCINYMQRNSWCGVPNTAVPYCSNYLKKRPIRAKAKAVFGTVKYGQMLGFRGEDMPKRITLSALSEMKGKIISPMLTHFDFPLYLRDLDKFWADQPFKLKINSRFGNCQLCWKKSDSNLIDIINNSDVSKVIKWYERMERNQGNTFFRGNRSIGDIVKMAKSKKAILKFDFSEGCECGI